MSARGLARCVVIVLVCSGTAPLRASWEERAPGPVGYLHRHAMTYDSARGVVVVFGGVDDNTDINETWEYDGSSWLERAVPPALTPRRWSSITFDEWRQRTVVHGGSSATETFAETWELDAAGWTPGGAVPAELGARVRGAMTFLRTDGYAVHFGGGKDDTWHYDGAWAPGGTTPTGLQGRSLVSLAYDSRRDVAILYGDDCDEHAGDVWTYDGQTWSPRITTGTPPSACEGFSFAYHEAADVAVLYGGLQDGYLFLNETWELQDGDRWVHSTIDEGWMHSSHEPRSAYDSGRERVVMYGGWDAPREVLEYRVCTFGLQPASLPGGNRGTPYLESLVASGGTGPFSFVVGSGQLPPGLVLDAAGTISGTPSKAGSWAFEIHVADAGGCALAFPYGIDVTDLHLWPEAIPPALVGVAYAVTFHATHGVPPYVLSIATGSLPQGLSFDPATGALSGVPAAPGTSTFEVMVVDGAGSQDVGQFDLAVGCVDVDGSSLPGASVGVPYSYLIEVSGGRPPFSFVAATPLPPGMQLDAATGTLSGNPSSSGSFPFQLGVTDGAGCETLLDLLLRVGAQSHHVAGEGLGVTNGNRVRLVDADGSSTTVLFPAYASGGWGTNVAAGDVDGGADPEILTGPGPGPVFGPHVRGWDDRGVPLSSVSFYAYGTMRSGVNVAAGAIDVDAFAEILTGAGPGATFGPHVRAFDHDGGGITPISSINFFAYGTPHHGVNVSAGDVDGNGADELVTGAGPGPSFAATVRGWLVAGGVVPVSGLAYDAYASTYGVNVACGDVDGDAFAEVLTAPGPQPSAGSRFLAMDFDGVGLGWVPGFNVVPFVTGYGGRVGAGDLQLTGTDALSAGAGPDPGADARVRPYRYDGSGTQPLIDFLPFGGSYGVNVSVAERP